jgi:hypothetical protein
MDGGRLVSWNALRTWWGPRSCVPETALHSGDARMLAREEDRSETRRIENHFGGLSLTFEAL